MANRIRTGDPMDSIKDVVWSSVKVPELDKHLKKAGGHIGRNVVEFTIKMNSPKTLNDKNHQASSQKFRQLVIKDQGFRAEFNRKEWTIEWM